LIFEELQELQELQEFKEFKEFKEFSGEAAIQDSLGWRLCGALGNPSPQAPRTEGAFQWLM